MTGAGPSVKPTAATAFTLPPLPYAENALEPVISVKTVRLHYGKHNKGYVDTLNELVAGTPFAEMSSSSSFLPLRVSPSTPRSSTTPRRPGTTHSIGAVCVQEVAASRRSLLKAHLAPTFGDLEALKEELGTAATTLFGSGWAWLVLDDAKLRVVKTGNAESPLTSQAKPLLTIDVWEHAYYLDFENKRADYVKGVIEKLINWEFAAQNLSST